MSPALAGGFFTTVPPGKPRNPESKLECPAPDLGCLCRIWHEQRDRHQASSVFSPPASRTACDPWKESGDVSDSGSSTTSGHWSGSSGVSTPSPPHPQASPKYLGDAFGSPQTDNGFETDPDAFLLDEPAPRKRKVSSLSFQAQPQRGQAWFPGPSRAPSCFSDPFF